MGDLIILLLDTHGPLFDFVFLVKGTWVGMMMNVT